MGNSCCRKKSIVSKSLEKKEILHLARKIQINCYTLKFWIAELLYFLKKDANLTKKFITLILKLKDPMQELAGTTEMDLKQYSVLINTHIDEIFKKQPLLWKKLKSTAKLKTLPFQRKISTINDLIGNGRFSSIFKRALTQAPTNLEGIEVTLGFFERTYFASKNFYRLLYRLERLSQRDGTVKLLFSKDLKLNLEIINQKLIDHMVELEREIVIHSNSLQNSGDLNDKEIEFLALIFKKDIKELLYIEEEKNAEEKSENESNWDSNFELEEETWNLQDFQVNIKDIEGGNNSIIRIYNYNEQDKRFYNIWG